MNTLFPKNDQQSFSKKPLAYRLAPQTFDEYIGQEHIVGQGKPIRELIEKDKLISLILWGPPGSGKTALSRLISQKTKSYYINLNAVTANIQDIKKAIQTAKFYQEQNQKQTILFLDEIHRFNKTQQDALLPDVENGLITLIGATTENPFFSVIPALVSRSQILELKPLSRENLIKIFDKALADPEIEKRKLNFSLKAKDAIINFSSGDARKLLNKIEMLVFSVPPQSKITLKLIEQNLGIKGISHNQDDHYDIISAYIKSIRGSDPDSAIYWLARMLAGGEDPEFIARRLIILASEDIGNADPMALVLATSLLSAIKFVGLPEAELNLSQVTAYLSLAPKSNASTIAINRAKKLIQEGKIYPVPKHLKDSHYKGAKNLNYGKGYKYPHDYDQAFVIQEYLKPKPLLYEPKPYGLEKTLLQKKQNLWQQ